MKKIMMAMLGLVLLLSLFSGCSKTDSGFDTSRSINVVSREDGSGTRGAFIELFGILVKGDDGTITDFTTKEAVVTNKTDVMLTNIESDKYAVGYVSMGSLNDKVKALPIDGVEANEANVKNGTYKVSRPFNIVTKGETVGLAKDFIDFILSREGQAIVAGSYISIDDNAAAYEGDRSGGKITVAGSSSVTPIMEKLKEAYIAINPNAAIEIQMSDSTSGVTGVTDGTCDIGMASRELKDSEKAELTATQIALDGIALIVNQNNPDPGFTMDEVNKIYTGEAIKWCDVME